MPDGRGELYHYSEDPSIALFEPRVANSEVSIEPLVWAVDPAQAYLYLFPRDCPRVTFYATPETSDADRECFYALTTASRVAAIESRWLHVMQATTHYRYVFPAEGFELFDEAAGYWVNRSTVRPLGVEPVGGLLLALAEEDVELRITPSLWPLYEQVIDSTLQFSIIRWRNAAPRRDNPPRSTRRSIRHG